MSIYLILVFFSDHGQIMNPRPGLFVYIITRQLAFNVEIKSDHIMLYAVFCFCRCAEC